jgi:two-component system, chemotaxis family, sensor kinase CheA
MSPRFFSEFLDDYFAECDEHLVSIRQHLLTLGPPGGVVDAAVLEDLLRSYHSLKGLSAMVGFDELSRLAHETEEYLRQVKQGASLSQEGIEALIAAANGIETALAARREGRAANVSQAATRLIEAVAANTPQAAAPSTTSGRRIWKFRFKPSVELSSRGIDVNSVRTQLREIGNIVYAVPSVSPNAEVTFEFHLSSAELSANIDDLVREGVLEHFGTVEPSGTEPQPSEASDIPTSSSGSANVVRVDMTRLDELMRLVGELVISRSRLDECLRTLAPATISGHTRVLQEINSTMERQVRDLRESVMQVRMVPIRQMFERMRFLVRSAERESDRQIVVQTSGDDTEIDKLVVERMMDPLLHLVRNAMSHGLESQQERLRAGKSPIGKLELRAFTSADMVIIEIEDDGRGIDETAVRARARASGTIVAELNLDSAELLNILCEPGFSTRQTADLESGRGIGMDVVKRAVAELGGTLSLRTTPGQGTCFTVALPLTLAITEALMVSADGQRFAVPQTFVHEVLRAESSSVRTMENNELIPYRDGVLPVVRLNRIFHLKEHPRPAFHVLVVGNPSKPVGLGVEKIVGQREIVVRGISDPLIRVPGVTGATEMGDGKPVLILDPRILIEQSGRANG